MSLTGGLSASLTCHLSMGLGGGVAAQSAAWNPGDLAGLAATLLPAESLAAGLLWQNTAKTIPATADGDPVRVAVCPYTAVEFTAPSDAARPLLYDEGGGKWSLSFDGVDDGLICTRAFAGDFEWQSRVRWTTWTDFQHTFTQIGQVPMIKRYSGNTYPDGDFRVYQGVEYRCVGSSPGSSQDSGWLLVGLSREATALYARVGSTDYTSGLTNSTTLNQQCVMGLAGGEKTPGRNAGIVVSSARLSDSDRSSLAAFVSGLS